MPPAKARRLKNFAEVVSRSRSTPVKISPTPLSPFLKSRAPRIATYEVLGSRSPLAPRPARGPVAGPEVGGRAGYVAGDGREPRELRRSSNAPSVEQLRHVVPEREHIRALEKEGTLLGEAGLERGQDQRRRICLHLTEVGIHGEVEGEIRCQTVLQIAADALFL